MSESDLFVVCKSCSSEVSPYVTECPYCGQRVRKRAPKIERPSWAEGASEIEPGPSTRRPAERTAPERARPERGAAERTQPEAGRPKRRSRRLPRMRPEQIRGVAPETRPWVTIGTVVLSLASTVAVIVLAAAGIDLLGLGAVVGPLGTELWRPFSAPFLHANYGYQFVTMVATAVFGLHLERRFGHLVPVAIFVLAGAAGAAVSAALSLYLTLGANGAALGLLSAWLVEDRLALRRGEDRDNDLLAVYVAAAVLLLLPLADPTASVAAGLTGALVGAVLGLLLPIFARR